MRQPLRYGGDLAFAPFEWLDAASGQPMGFQVELLAELQRELDQPITIALRPWAETMAAFRAGALDLVAMVDTDSRRAHAVFARGHATPSLALYLPQGRPERQGVPALSGMRIAVLDGEAMRDTLAHGLAQVSGPFVHVADARQALLAVREGRADLALLPRAYGEVARAGLNARGDGPPLSTGALDLNLQTYAFAVAPGNVELLDRIEQALARIEADGRLPALRLRWLGSHRLLADRQRLQQGVLAQRHWTWGLGASGVVAVAGLGWALHRRGQRIASERARRMQAQAALAQAQELVQRTFAHNPEPMLLVDSGSRIVRDANIAMLELLQVQAPALLEQPLHALTAHVDVDALEPLMRALQHTDALDATPLGIRRADGTRRDCLVSAERMTIGGRPQVLCVVRDVTEALLDDPRLGSAYLALAEELAQARGALGAAEHGLQRAERARRLAETRLQDFTRSVAHELKTPLNAVQGFAGLLRMRLDTGHLDEARLCSDHIERAARRMDRMIGALAQLSRVGRQALVRVPIDMRRQAEDSWALLQAARLHGEQDFEGTGLGLSLVRRIVEHHHGEVRLHSQPGVGTTSRVHAAATSRSGCLGRVRAAVTRCRTPSVRLQTSRN